jgi:solute carrier family 25 (mitochondrial aspartate/glutamate transporter), member 12/13
VWKAEGLRGLFGNVPIALLRDAPFSLIYFTAYEVFKNFQKRHTTIPHGFWSHMACGGAAGAIAATVTIPFDVVKTRLQTQNTLGEKKYHGIAHAFRTIVREEGAKALTG